MAREKILIVDDEEDVLELLRYNLDKNGYKVESADSGEEAVSKTRGLLPDLVVLDLMLPGIDGLEVCRILKGDAKTRHIPVVMLTAKGEESDIVTGLELGADDYVTKPFSPRVLIARIKKLLSRARQPASGEGVIKIHDLVINPERHEVMVKNKPVDLTNTEFNILCTLARRPGMVFSRYQIVDAIHGSDYLVTERAVDVQIVSLRRKLGQAGRDIETVRGVGYRFRD
jgi:two-component system, OmpR family, alkaline phosphatase synthesis response regulator PhoP